MASSDLPSSTRVVVAGAAEGMSMTATRRRRGGGGNGNTNDRRRHLHYYDTAYPEDDYHHPCTYYHYSSSGTRKKSKHDESDDDDDNHDWYDDECETVKDEDHDVIDEEEVEYDSNDEEYVYADMEENNEEEDNEDTSSSTLAPWEETITPTSTTPTTIGAGSTTVTPYPSYYYWEESSTPTSTPTTTIAAGSTTVTPYPSYYYYDAAAITLAPSDIPSTEATSSTTTTTILSTRPPNAIPPYYFTLSPTTSSSTRPTTTIMFPTASPVISTSTEVGGEGEESAVPTTLWPFKKSDSAIEDNNNINKDGGDKYGQDASNTANENEEGTENDNDTTNEDNFEAETGDITTEEAEIEGSTTTEDGEKDDSFTPSNSNDDDIILSACDAAQYGQVYTTMASQVLYYQYELLTTKIADWKDVVWPAVDVSVQQLLALQMVHCDANTTEVPSMVRGVSPDPKDSFGTYVGDGGDSSINNASIVTPSCSHIVEYDENAYVCDVVTGSVTIYYSEILYMNTLNETKLHLDTQNEAFAYLQNANNDNEIQKEESRNRTLFRMQHHRRGLQSSFLDESQGIYGLFFLSEPTDVLIHNNSKNDSENTGAGPTLTESIQGTSTDKDNENSTSQVDSRPINPAVIASVTGFTFMTMLIVGFLIHRRRSADDDNDDVVIYIKPIGTKPTDVSDLDGPELALSGIADDNDGKSEDNSIPMIRVDTTVNSDSFRIQDAPNAFREDDRKNNSRDKSDLDPAQDKYKQATAMTEDTDRSSSYQASTLSETTASEQESSSHTSSRYIPAPIDVGKYVHTLGISPNTARPTNYSVEESVGEDPSHTYSHDEISMMLTSPEFVNLNHLLKSAQQQDSDPLLQGNDRSADEEDEQARIDQIHAELKVLSSILDTRDESPTKRVSEPSPGTSSGETWTTRTISVGSSASTSGSGSETNPKILNADNDRDSVMTTGATIGMSIENRFDRAIGNFVQSPPFDLSYASNRSVLLGQTKYSAAENVEDTKQPLFPSSSISPINTSENIRGSLTNNSTGGSVRSVRRSPVLNFGSPNVGLDFSRHSPSETYPAGVNSATKRQQTMAVAEFASKMDPPSSAEILRKVQHHEVLLRSESESSESSRTDYLKSRRRAMEEQFENYKVRVSEKVTKPDLVVRTPSDDDRLDRSSSFGGGGLDEEEEYRDKRCVLSAEQCPLYSGSFPTGVGDSCTKRGQITCGSGSKGRSGSSAQKTPRMRKYYAPLNEVDELLDLYLEWKQSEANESKKSNALVSLRSRSASLDQNDGKGSSHREESQTLGGLLSPRLYSANTETRLYPVFQSDTVQF